MTSRPIRASVHRPATGTISYVWVENREYVCASSTEVFRVLARRGTPRLAGTFRNGDDRVDEFLIERTP